jgi:hypothetical protein
MNIYESLSNQQDRAGVHLIEEYAGGFANSRGATISNKRLGKPDGFFDRDMHLLKLNVNSNSVGVIFSDEEITDYVAGDSRLRVNAKLEKAIEQIMY